MLWKAINLLQIYELPMEDPPVPVTLLLSFVVVSGKVPILPSAIVGLQVPLKNFPANPGVLNVDNVGP